LGLLITTNLIIKTKYLLLVPLIISLIKVNVIVLDSIVQGIEHSYTLPLTRPSEN